MNIKISEGHGVTEIIEDKGIWRIKRNNAGVGIVALKKVIEVMNGDKYGK